GVGRRMAVPDERGMGRVELVFADVEAEMEIGGRCRMPVGVKQGQDEAVVVLEHDDVVVVQGLTQVEEPHEEVCQRRRVGGVEAEVLKSHRYALPEDADTNDGDRGVRGSAWEMAHAMHPGT